MAIVEAQEAQASGGDEAAIEAEWIDAVGEDNWNGLIALTVDPRNQSSERLPGTSPGSPSFPSPRS